ncbi:hypothetical protein CN918_31115 [Priestia megaterium]|nr:hypothetical protein CN918_31115 [Priestia megaterium]
MCGTEVDTISLTKKMIHEITSSPNWEEVIDVINGCKYGNPIGKSVEDRVRYVVKLLNMDYIGCGDRRIVMTSKKSKLTSLVVKMPLDFTGFEENDEEAGLWRVANDAVRHDIVPVLAWEEEFLVSRRVEPFTREKGLLYKDTIYAVHKRLRANGLIPIDIHPDRYDQWGLLDGRVVALDTASCILQDRAKRKRVLNI